MILVNLSGNQTLIERNVLCEVVAVKRPSSDRCVIDRVARRGVFGLHKASFVT